MRGPKCWISNLLGKCWTFLASGSEARYCCDIDNNNDMFLSVAVVVSKRYA